MARHAPHGGEHARVADAAPGHLLVHHPFALARVAAVVAVHYGLRLRFLRGAGDARRAGVGGATPGEAGAGRADTAGASPAEPGTAGRAVSRRYWLSSA